MKTKSRIELVREACSEFKDTPTKTLARALYAKHEHLWPSLDACYSAVRNVRGNHGARNRANYTPDLFRRNQPAGFKWHFPETKAESWEPFILESERSLVLSDLHIPFHDPPAIRVSIGEGKKFLRKNDAIVLNGDVGDFYTISRFDKCPTKTALLEEIKTIRQFLGWLRQKFPQVRIIYKLGNHDERLEHYVWRKAPELCGLEHVTLKHILTDKLENEPEIGGIEWVEDQRKIVAGHLDILHGHELGKATIAPPVNPARGFFLKTMECTLAGHLHRTSFHPERSSRGKQIACWSTGCLCGLWPDYARVNKWDHSAARLDLSGDNFRVTPLRIIDGKLV